PSAKPMARWDSLSGPVVRAWAGAKAGRRSQKMDRGHAGLAQRNFRAVKTIDNVRPQHGRSFTRRVYRLCTCSETWPHRGQSAVAVTTAISTVTTSGPTWT